MAHHLLTLSEGQIRDLDEEIKKCHTGNGHRRIIYENSCHIWQQVDISEAEKQKRRQSKEEENKNKKKKLKYPDFTVSQLRTKNKRVPVHAISYFLRFRKVAQWPPEVISHLCHNERCSNADHLSLEKQRVNLSRKPCKDSGFCHGGHGSMADCVFPQKSEGTQL